MQDLSQKICLCLLALASLNFAAAGQIRIPKIFGPKTNTTIIPPAPQNSTPQNPQPTPGDENRQAVRQPVSQSGGNYIDDGYTWFEAVGTEELNAQHRPVTTGWVLSSQIRMVGTYPRQSAIKIKVAKEGKMLATTRCEAFQYTEDRHSANVPPHFVTISCLNKNATIKEPGKFDVQVILINGETDAEAVVRNYKIEVLKVDRIGGGFSNPQPDAPHYYISRHAEAPVSLLFLRPANTHSYIGEDERSPIINADTVEIYYNLSPSKEGKDVRDGYLRCTVDGRPLEMRDDKSPSGNERHYEEVYTDRLAAVYKNGTEYRDEIGFMWVRMVLPVTFGSGRNNSRTNLNDHPGSWECSLMNNGTTWRTWRWKIGADGMPVKHAEQNDNVNLYYNTFLIETEIPAGGTILDKRLAPVSVADGFFYGQKWTSVEGRAMAGKVPTKGSLTPLPSNKVK